MLLARYVLLMVLGLNIGEASAASWRAAWKQAPLWKKSLCVGGGSLVGLQASRMWQGESSSMLEPEQALKKLDVTLEKDEFEQALRYFTYFSLRVDIDSTCSIDLSVRAAKNQLTMKILTDPHFRKFIKETPLGHAKYVLAQEIDVVERQVENNELSGPEWIKKYGMSAFLDPDGQTFIAPLQCKKKRIETLREMRREISDRDE